MTTFRDRHGEAKIAEIDLETEEFVYRGRRLTDEGATERAEETLAEVRRRNLLPGGKSLSGGDTHSPVVQFRVPKQLRAQLEERAAAEGVSPSKVARRALEQYLQDTS